MVDEKKTEEMTQEERDAAKAERLKNIKCHTCGEMGHYKRACPTRVKGGSRAPEEVTCHNCGMAVSYFW